MSLGGVCLPCFWLFALGLTLHPLVPVCGDEWIVSDPAAMGLNTDALEEYRVLCQRSGADACLVAYRGAIVLEWYGPGYREPIYTMSSVKSWTALLVGMLIADGAIGGIDDLVSKYIPEWTYGAAAGVTIRHLLTMTSGLDTRSSQTGPRQSIGFSAEKDRFAFGLPLDFEPGSRWAYSNEGAQLLSPIIDRASGIPAARYARERLFEPAGMARTSLHEFPAGQAWTYADAETTLRDFARIGQLVLDEGVVGGRQVVPAAWIRKCLTPTRQNPAYGLMWWLHYQQEDGLRGFISNTLPRLLGLRVQRSRPSVASTQGYRHTDCYVLLDAGIVAARMQMKGPPPGAPVYTRRDALRVLDDIVPPAE